MGLPCKSSGGEEMRLCMVFIPIALYLTDATRPFFAFVASEKSCEETITLGEKSFRFLKMLVGFAGFDWDALELTLTD